MQLIAIVQLKEKLGDRKETHNKEMLNRMRALPGKIVHADIITSLVPGITPHMVGFMTLEKFHHACFFVCDKSDFTFVHHQQSTSVDYAIIEKRAYEAELRRYGKEVRYHHAENGTYAVAKHKKEIEDKKQSLTFFGVGSHRQNGKA